MLTTDGPYAEGKEHLGGFTIIAAPDLDAALDWGRKLSRATTLPVEVRPFQAGTEPLTCPSLATSEIGRVFREEYGRAVAVLVRVFGDIDIAEEAVQDAFTTAVQRWPSDGLPPSPAGWIITTARNRAIDRLRREASRDDRHAQAALLHAGSEPVEEGAVPDDRLRLIFTCCHPSLAPGAQVALTLRLLGGLTHRGDRARVPRSRADDGAAPGPRQEQDPRRRDPVPRAERGRPPRPARERCSPSSTSSSTRATPRARGTNSCVTTSAGRPFASVV